MADSTLVRSVLFTLIFKYAAAIFFHEASLISVLPDIALTYSNFGFSMGYMNNSIVIGAPTAKNRGFVYSCNVKRTNVDPTAVLPCSRVDVQNYRKSKNIKQTPYFGASIATTLDQCLTCAPMWSADKPKSDIFGWCAFWKSNDAGVSYARVKDNYNKYEILEANGNAADFKSKYIVGGAGWSTLIDEENDLFMIIKSSLEGDIMYGSLNRDNTMTTNSSVMGTALGGKLPSFFNFGFGYAMGKFFSNKTVYAFSMEDKNYIIEFFEYDEKFGIQSINPKFNSGSFATIVSNAPGTKFGSVMAAADLNKDGLSELLVGAPLHTIDDCVECGTLHIYLGGDNKTMSSRNWLRIMGAKEFGRFTTAIAAKDIDGDGIPELAISAPYEDEGSGAVYIISGYEIYLKLKGPKEFKPIQLSELIYTQTIKKKNFINLGFSLQFIPDIDNNGCSELVVGAPGNDKAMLLKSLKTITVKISSALIGDQVVREQDTSFTVQVCAVVDYPKLYNNVNASLQVNNNIIGERAKILTPSFQLDISCNDSSTKTFCSNVTVNLSDKENASYVFISSAMLSTDHLINSTKFNPSWAVESPNSKLVSRLPVSRHCSGDDCMPKLSLLPITWSHSQNTYVLGSSATETAFIVVSNNGKSSYYEACVFVAVKGTQLSQTRDCVSYKDGYKCSWPKPLKRDAKHSINLRLIMEPTNWHNKFEIEAKLLENCNNDDVIKNSQKLVVSYVFNTDGVDISGDDVVKQVPDKQIEDRRDYITEDQEFLITNNGNMTWSKVKVIVTAKRTRFIDKFKVMDIESCRQEHTDDVFVNVCEQDLMPNNKRKIIATTYILKEHISEHLISKRLNVTSQVELRLSPTDVKFNKTITSTLIINKEVAVSQDKTLIAVIAGCVGIFVLIVLVAVLYKIGFFKRRQKQRLHVLRESVKQRNSRRNTHVSSATDEQGIDYMEMNEEDEEAFDDVPITKSKPDDSLQVETKAEVHKRGSS